MRKRLMTLVLGGVLLAAPALAAPGGLVVFGDSLVDAGNIRAATGGLVPSAAQGYYQGRFSNGPTWVDIINWRLTGQATRASLTGGSNYAFGGARAASDKVEISPLTGQPVLLPGLDTQLGLWAAGGNSVDPAKIYVVSFGNNDVTALRTAAERYLVNTATTPPTVTPVSVAVYTQTYVQKMIGTSLAALAGGATVVVGEVPNPFDPTSIALQNALDAGWAAAAANPATSGLVAAGLASGRLVRFNYAGSFAAIAANPAAFGLSPTLNIAGNCLADAPVVGGVRDCTNFFSFDGIHPTRQIHQVLAREIAPRLGLAVPEPASWAMLIAGFGLTGAALRRRRAAVAA